MAPTRPTPAGVTAISRWSSAATPPEGGRYDQPIPEGWQKTHDFDRPMNPRLAPSLASLRDARVREDRVPVVSLRSTTG